MCERREQDVKETYLVTMEMGIAFLSFLSFLSLASFEVLSSKSSVNQTIKLKMFTLNDVLTSLRKGISRRICRLSCTSHVLSVFC